MMHHMRPPTKPKVSTEIEAHLRRQTKTVDRCATAMEGYHLPLHGVVKPNRLYQLPVEPRPAHLDMETNAQSAICSLVLNTPMTSMISYYKPEKGRIVADYHTGVAVDSHECNHYSSTLPF